MIIFGYDIAIGNAIGAVSFVSLLLFLVLYFLKPKPMKKVIPSLIFLEMSEKKISLLTFLGKFVKDWLFLVQLLVFLLMCFSAMGLFTFAEMKMINREMVFVIDASGSSKTLEDGRTRFDTAIDMAKKNLGLQNSIILIKNVPVLAAKETNPVNAGRVLSGLKPTDTSSNIWDAMIMAGDVAKSPAAEIVVLSDFIDANGKNPAAAKEILESKGYKVRMVNLAKTRDNVAIIDYTLNSDSTATMDIKNYDTVQKTVTVKETGDTVNLAPLAIESVKVPVKEGQNRFTLDADDRLKADNTLYISIPKTKQSSVLFISNKKRTNAQLAISSVRNIKTVFAEPPIVPSLDYDIIVFDSVSKGSIIAGTMDDLRSAVEGGTSLVIIADDNLPTFEFSGLMPVNIKTLVTGATPVVNTRTLSEFADVNYGQSSRFFKTELNNNQSVVLAQSLDGIPMITLTKYGMGSVLYYGIFDDSNSFKFSTDYPIFWVEVMKKLANRQPAETFNLKVGDVVYAPDGKKVIDPDSVSHDASMISERAGFYTAGDKTFAVNFANAAESAIYSDEIASDKAIFQESLASEKTRQRVDLHTIMLLAACLFLLLDLFIIKSRGDL